MDRIILSDRTVVDTVSVELPDGAVAKEFELPSGNARVRAIPVPPMLITDVLSARPDLIEPPIPKVKVGGVTEKWLTARPGEKEYAEWESRILELERLRDDVWNDTWWNYGVVEWSFDGKTWSEEPPKGWKLPTRVKRMGVKPRSGPDGKRVDFIRYRLLPTNADVEVCQMAMSGTTEPIRPEEVQAVADLFQGEEGREGDIEPTTE